MAGARQAVSRLRARGPRRIAPPRPEADPVTPGARAGDPSGGSGPVSAGSGRRAGHSGRRGVGSVDGAGSVTAARPKGVTRRGGLRRMWFDRGPGYRIWAGGPVPPGAAAWTLGSLVIVRRRSAHNRTLLAHEEEHVRQWAERGRIGFLVWYLRGYLPWRLRGHPHTAAYRRIPAEIEADWRSRRRLGIGTGAEPGDRAAPPA